MNGASKRDVEREQELAAMLTDRAKTEKTEERGPSAACRGCPYQSRENLLRLLGERQ